MDFTSKSYVVFDLHIEEGHKKSNDNLKRSHSQTTKDNDDNITENENEKTGHDILHKCETCNILFNTRHAMNKHMRNHKTPSISSPPTKKLKDKENLDETESPITGTDLSASQRLLLPELGFLEEINKDLNISLF